MKESHRKSLAHYPDPESCVVRREAAIEALTGAHAGRVLSCEITAPECRRRTQVGRPHPARRYGESRGDSAQSRDPGHVWKLHAREPGDPGTVRWALGGPVGEGQ